MCVLFTSVRARFCCDIHAVIFCFSLSSRQGIHLWVEHPVRHRHSPLGTTVRWLVLQRQSQPTDRQGEQGYTCCKSHDTLPCSLTSLLTLFLSLPCSPLNSLLTLSLPCSPLNSLLTLSSLFSSQLLTESLSLFSLFYIPRSLLSYLFLSLFVGLSQSTNFPQIKLNMGDNWANTGVSFLSDISTWATQNSNTHLLYR